MVVGTKESELLSAFLDRELNGSELRMVQQQLATSSEWREELERIKKSKDLVADLPQVAAPTYFLESLERRLLEQQDAQRFHFFQWSSWSKLSQQFALGGALATAAVFAGVFHLYQVQHAEFIPMDSLISAHNMGQTSPLLHQRVLAASEQTAHVKSHV